MDEAGARRCIEQAVDFGLLQEIEFALALVLSDEITQPPLLYQPPGLLTPWLVSRRTQAEEPTFHARLAAFWRSVSERNQFLQSGVTVEHGLRACLEHAEAAGDQPQRHWAARRSGARLHEAFRWPEALVLLDSVPEAGREADDWHRLSRVQESVGNWGEARDSLKRWRALTGESIDRKAEAAYWHSMGTIDVKVADYPAARSNFEKAQQMLQQIGDRAGEAATWHSLGGTAWEGGQRRLGLRLVCLGFGLSHAIGSADAEKMGPNVVGMAQTLGLAQEELVATMQAVAQEYVQDRGQALLAELMNAPPTPKPPAEDA